jgi:hypothetical protein
MEGCGGPSRNDLRVCCLSRGATRGRFPITCTATLPMTNCLGSYPQSISENSSWPFDEEENGRAGTGASVDVEDGVQYALASGTRNNGIVLGALVSVLVSKFSPLPSHVLPMSIVAGLAFSVGIGLFFGIYPAWRAARLDPIEALRYE